MGQKLEFNSMVSWKQEISIYVGGWVCEDNLILWVAGSKKCPLAPPCFFFLEQPAVYSTFLNIRMLQNKACSCFHSRPTLRRCRMSYLPVLLYIR